MKTLLFTLAISIIIHILLLVDFEKNNKIGIKLSPANIIEVSVIKSTKDGNTYAKDINGSDKISKKNTNNNKHNKLLEKEITNKKKKKDNQKDNVLQSAKSGLDGYSKELYIQGYASFLPKPEYPLLSRRNKEEGTVIFNISLNNSGDMINYIIIQSSGYKRLDKQAEKSIKAAKFQPALKNGKPISTNFDLKITFTLKGK